MRIETAVRAFWPVVFCSSLAWLVAACAAPPTTPVPTGPVDGTVLKGGLFPISGIIVRIQGQATLTDAEGRFAFEDVSVPYDLSLSQTSGDGWLHVIEGLTDRSPTVDPIGPELLSGAPPSADVTGALTGGGIWPLPPDRRVVVCTEGLDVLVFGCDSVSPGDSTYDLTANMLAGGQGTVRVHGLRMVVDAAGRPTGYEGYGFADVDLTPGVAVVVPVHLGVVPAVADLEIAFDLPGGASLPGVLVSLRLGAQGSLVLFQDAVAGESLTLPVPTLAGASYAVYASATTGTGAATRWAVVDGLDVGPLDFAIPPQLTAPAAGAVDVTAETAFAVVGASSGPRTFRWTSAGGPTLALTTTRTSVALPDLVAAGFAWPSGVTYAWSVLDVGAPTVDDAVAWLDPSVLGLAIFVGYDVSSSGSYAASETRSATLAP